MPVCQLKSLTELLAGLNLDEFELKATQTEKNGFRATKVDILVGEQPPERHLRRFLR